MMNANVRRLVFDLSPRWLLWVQVLGWLILGASAASDGSTAGPFLGIWGSFWGLICVSKFAAWQSLPIRFQDIKRAQVWVLVGVPFITIITANTSGVGYAILSDRFNETISFILAKISCQLIFSTSWLFYVSPNLLSKRLKDFWNLIISILLLISTALALNLTLGISKSHTILHLTILLGIISILSCISALVWSQYLPLVSPGKSSPSRGARPSEPSSATPSRAYRPPTGRSGVWRLFASSIGRVAPFAGVAYGLLAMVFLAPKPMGISALEMPMAALALAPLVCSVLAQVALLEPPQVRGGLPVSALGSTAALQLVLPALLIPAWVLMIALGAMFRPDAMTPHWWIAGGFTSLVALCFGAASYPVTLRLGRLGLPVLFGGLCGGVVGSTIGSSPMSFGQRWAFEGRPSLGDMTTIGALILMVILGWIWTYLELAYWRKAYQPQTLIPTRWRGAAT